MKKLLLLISFLLSAVITKSQWVYTSVEINSTTNWNVAYRPTDNLVPQPVIFILPGAGQAGTNIATFMNSGEYPQYWINTMGWNGVVFAKKPIFVLLQTGSSTGAGDGVGPTRAILRFLDTLANYCNVDRNRVYITSLSRGAAQELLGLRQDQGNTFYNTFAGYFGLSIGINSTFNNTRYSNWLDYGGRSLLTVGTDDADSTLYTATMQWYRYSNSRKPGSSLLYLKQGVGHGGWQVEYNPATKRWNGLNAYENLLTYSKQPYTSIADSNVVLPSGTTSYTLNGITKEYHTGQNGWNASTSWSKISGNGTITTPSSDTTGITGLTNGVTIVRLTRTNASDGQTAQTNVTITVGSTPPPTPPGIYRVSKMSKFN